MLPQEIVTKIVHEYNNLKPSRGVELSALFHVSRAFYYPAREILFSQPLTVRYVHTVWAQEPEVPRTLLTRRVQLLEDIITKHTPDISHRIHELAIELNLGEADEDDYYLNDPIDVQPPPPYDTHFVNILKHLTRARQIHTLEINAHDGFVEPDWDMTFEMSRLPLEALQAITALRCIPSIKALTLRRIFNAHPLLLTGLPGQGQLKSLVIKAEDPVGYNYSVNSLYPFTEADLPRLMESPSELGTLIGRLPFGDLEYMFPSLGKLFPWVACRPFSMVPPPEPKPDVSWAVGSSDQDDEDSQPEFRLPRLKCLEIVGWECGTETRDMVRVLNLAPALEGFAFDIDSRRYVLRDETDPFIRSLRKKTSIRTIDFTIRSRHYDTLAHEPDWALVVFNRFLKLVHPHTAIRHLSFTLKFEDLTGHGHFGNTELLMDAFDRDDDWEALRGTLAEMDQLNDFSFGFRVRYWRGDFDCEAAATARGQFLGAGGPLSVTHRIMGWGSTAK